jgi:hypothetical protein
MCVHSDADLRGVDIKISCDRLSQSFISRIFWCALANAPGGSSFQKGLAHAAMYASWNSRWW